MKKNLSYAGLVRALTCFESISEVSGAGKKNMIKILLQTNFNYEMWWLLNIALDPLKATSLKTIEAPYHIPNPHGDDQNVQNLFKVVEEAISKKAHSDDSREQMAQSIAYINLNVSHRNILIKIITRTFNIGLGIKQVNQALPGTIPYREVMLIANDKKKWERIKRDLDMGIEIGWEYKWDGVRVTWWNEQDCFMTRTFRPIESRFFPALAKKLRAISAVAPDYVLDGELELIGDRNRKKLSGQTNSILKGKGEEGIGDGWKFTIFDYIHRDVFTTKDSEDMLEGRLAQLEEVLIQSQVDLKPNIELSVLHQVHSVEEIEEAFNSALSMGLEGIVVKYLASSYETKRSKKWIRMKAEETIDLRVVDWFEGKPGTKREDTIGGLICESECGLIRVRVGSGFSDEELEGLSSIKDDISEMGLIVEIVYNELIQNKDTEATGQYSLYLPRFIAVRTDKSTANDLSEIL